MSLFDSLGRLIFVDRVDGVGKGHRVHIVLDSQSSSLDRCIFLAREADVEDLPVEIFGCVTGVSILNDLVVLGSGNG